MTLRHFESNFRDIARCVAELNAALYLLVQGFINNLNVIILQSGHRKEDTNMSISDLTTKIVSIGLCTSQLFKHCVMALYD